jgi:hypothetical protein
VSDPKQFAAVLAVVAPGFTTRAVGEKRLGLLKHHFGRPVVIRTHPITRGIPCILTRTVELPTDVKSKLRLSVAHDAYGDWQLIVKANRQILHDRIVGPGTTKNGWADLEIDLSRFAGQRVDLELHNHPNDWWSEWGYWGQVEIVPEPTRWKRFLTLLRGEDEPADNAERLSFAQTAYDQRKFAFATRLFAEALESDPKLGDDRHARRRYIAARAAALAAAGQSEDGPPRDTAARAKLRHQALDWLKAELLAWTKLLKSGPPELRPFIEKTLRYWQQDGAFTGMRDVAALARLPAGEQREWHALWADFADLMADATFPLDPFAPSAQDDPDRIAR